jgi:hypothetical protein
MRFHRPPDAEAFTEGASSVSLDRVTKVEVKGDHATVYVRA